VRIDGIARVRERSDYILVAFSGSRGHMDWLRNLDPRARQAAPGEWVSRADYREARAVYDAVAPLADNRTVYIVGFSRGGAIAQIFARLLSSAQDVRVELYAPKRAGNGRFVSRLLRMRRLYARYYGGDIVPFLPPWLAQVGMIRRDITLPWVAHRRAARDAARRRHEIGR